MAEFEVTISTLRTTADLLEAARQVIGRCREITESLPRVTEMAGSDRLGRSMSGFLDELDGSLRAIGQSAAELEERLQGAAATYATTESAVAGNTP